QPGDQPNVWIMGVLTDGVDIESAEAELNASLQALGQRLPEFYNNLGATLIPFTRFLAPSMTYWNILTGLTVALLLLVSLNVANLLVVRTTERIQELAIRSALGATPWLLIRSVLLDSLLICILGLALGALLADLGMTSIGAMMSGIYQDVSQTRPPSWSTGYNWELGTIITTGLTIGLIWLFSSVFAVWKIIRHDISMQLGGGSTGSAISGRSNGNAALVTFEVIFSCFLLIFCGALVGTANEMSEIEYGTATDGYLTGRIALPTTSYSDTTSREVYRQNLRQELLQQEGISEVVFVSSLPSQQGIPVAYNLEDRNVLTESARYPTQEIVYVGPDYFTAMDVPLREGREFDGSENATSLPVVIINELFAQQMWPDESAIGKRIEVNPESEDSEWLTVVGVTSHIIQRWSYFGTNVPVLYRPFSQSPANRSVVPQAGLAQSSSEVFHVVLKVDEVNPDQYRRVLQEAATRVDRDVPITFLFLLAELLELTNAMSIISTTISSNIALFTLVLAVTGIYAIVARSVNQRAREIGIRRALGSSDRNVLWVFIRQGFKYLAAGLLIGGGGAVLVSNAMSIIFVGIGGWVPISFIGVSLGLGLLIFFAAYHPASNLVAIEPGDALHYE
ncbi:MAG: ABC transporter permease, partial [Pseudomonadales bacterium]|nr:ABC transporter permease [Pseudomonadales bacterium]